MNKTIVAILIAVVLVGGGAAYYVASNSNTNSQNASEGAMMESNESNTMEMSEDGEISGSFADLLKLGKSYTCDFDYTDDSDNNTVGTVYVANEGNKFSGDFTMTSADGTVITSSALRDDTYTYVWSSSLPQGYKFENPQDESDLFSGVDMDTADNFLLDEDQNIDFDCKAWRVDNSVFTPPADVEFVSITEAMEGMMDIDMCSSCDLIEDAAAKAQCLQTFGC